LKVSMRTFAFLAIILIFNLGFSLANASTTKSFSVRVGNQATVVINLQSGQAVAGSFNITGAGTDDIVSFWVRNPMGETILDSGAVANGENFTFAADINGEYVLNFENNAAYNKHIDLVYDVTSSSIIQGWGVDPIVFIVLAIVMGVVVVAVIGVAIYRSSQARRTNTQLSNQPAAPICPYCGQSLRWVPENQKWYCEREKKYL
jgi:hypothetical protein